MKEIWKTEEKKEGKKEERNIKKARKKYRERRRKKEKGRKNEWKQERKKKERENIKEETRKEREELKIESNRERHFEESEFTKMDLQCCFSEFQIKNWSWATKWIINCQQTKYFESSNKSSLLIKYITWRPWFLTLYNNSTSYH